MTSPLTSPRAAGVMLPRLNSAEEVRAAVRHLRYPPDGDRGVATYNRACRFGLDPGALDRAADDDPRRRLQWAELTDHRDRTSNGQRLNWRMSNAR